MNRPFFIFALALFALGACKSESSDPEQQAAAAEDPTPATPNSPTSADASAAAGADVAAGQAREDEDEERMRPGDAPTRSVFDLYDNRFLAHGVRHGGLVAELGLPGGGRYMRGGLGPEWSLRHTIDGVAVSAPTGRRARLHVPLSAAQASTASTLALRFYNNAPNQQLAVAWRGHALGTQTIEQTGWTTLRFELPPGIAAAGENELGLAVTQNSRLDDIRAGVALAALAVLPADAPALELSTEALAVTAGERRALSLAHGQGLAWYVMVPQDGRLELEIAGAPTCLLEVRADSPQRAGATLATEVAAGGPRSVDLSALSGAVARLELVAAGECPRLELVAPRLAVPGAEPQMPADVEPPRHVVIWLIDTLRADHLKLYNPDTDVVTPHLDAFAKEHGVVFERVYSDGNESKVSHSSLFTGLYPIRHRHYRSSTRLADSLELIPEAMRRAGLTTAGFVSNGYISDTWGFEQGWDRFVNTIREGRASSASSLMKIAEPWLREHADEPFFAYFGTIDPHVHYFRHPEFIDLYDPNDAANMKAGNPFIWKCSGRQLHAIARGELKVGEAEKARIKALYKNEISYNDKHFGRMLALLDELGIRDQTMIVVLADHGEEFWEHGGVGHARTLYQHTVHVPLIVSYPPLFPPGTRVAEGADLIDIYSTLAAHLDIEPPPEGLQGQDLVALANGLGAGYPAPTLSTMGSRRYAMQLADYKLAVEYDGRAKLHHIVDDPWEATDLATSPEHAYVTRFAHDAFGTFLAHRAQWQKSSMGTPSNLKPGFAQSPK